MKSWTGFGSNADVHQGQGVPGASSCRRACALSGRAPEKVGWLYSIGHLVRTGVFSCLHTRCSNFDASCRVSRADRVGRATGGSSPSPSGPRLKALKSIKFNLGLKRSYSPIILRHGRNMPQLAQVRIYGRIRPSFRVHVNVALICMSKQLEAPKIGEIENMHLRHEVSHHTPRALQTARASDS